MQDNKPDWKTLDFAAIKAHKEGIERWQKAVYKALNEASIKFIVVHDSIIVAEGCEERFLQILRDINCNENTTEVRA